MKRKIFNSIKKLPLPLIFLILAILFAILHNLVYGLTGFEEPVFFLLTLVSIIALFFTGLHKIFITACSLLNRKP